MKTSNIEYYDIQYAAERTKCYVVIHKIQLHYIVCSFHQLIHFGYISNFGLKLQVVNTSNPFNLYSVYSQSTSDSLNPKLFIHYVSP